MFGPYSTVKSSLESGGGTIILSLIIKVSGIFTSGYAPKSLGSVKTPVKAETAATSGLQR